MKASNVRTLILSNMATRLMFLTGVSGALLMTLDSIVTRMKLGPVLEAQGLTFAVQQQVLAVMAVALFASGHWLAAAERRAMARPRQSFLDLLLEFWQFRPLRNPSRAYRVLEAAHLSLIVLMFHRALFL